MISFSSSSSSYLETISSCLVSFYLCCLKHTRLMFCYILKFKRHHWKLNTVDESHFSSYTGSSFYVSERKSFFSSFNFPWVIQSLDANREKFYFSFLCGKIWKVVWGGVKYGDYRRWMGLNDAYFWWTLDAIFVIDLEGLES